MSSWQIAMTYPPSLWPPRKDDRVTIKGKPLDGIVQRIEGSGPDARYILEVYGRDSVTRQGVRENALEAGATRTTYTLDELEPFN